MKKEDYQELPESLKDAIAKEVRPNWGMFYDNTWLEEDKDLEVIEDSVVLSVVFRWLAGKEE